MKITVWQRYNPQTKTWHHNHISNGWDEQQQPEPKSSLQKRSWASGVWRKEFGCLVDGVFSGGAEHGLCEMHNAGKGLINGWWNS